MSCDSLISASVSESDTSHKSDLASRSIAVVLGVCGPFPKYERRRAFRFAAFPMYMVIPRVFLKKYTPGREGMFLCCNFMGIPLL